MSLIPFFAQLFEDIGYLARAAAAGEEDKLAGDRASAAIGRIGITAGTVNAVGSTIIQSLEHGLPWHKTHKADPKAAPAPPGPPPGPPSSLPVGDMDEYSGFAKPRRGIIGLHEGQGVGLPPMHVDSELRRFFANYIRMHDARQSDYEEIDTARGQGRRRGRRRTEDMRNTRRRIDFDFEDIIQLANNWGH